MYWEAARRRHLGYRTSSLRSTRPSFALKFSRLLFATGGATIEDVGWEIVRLMLDVASGRKQTWSDRWGLHNTLAPFNPGPVT